MNGFQLHSFTMSMPLCMSYYGLSTYLEHGAKPPSYPLVNQHLSAPHHSKLLSFLVSAFHLLIDLSLKGLSMLQAIVGNNSAI